MPRNGQLLDLIAFDLDGTALNSKRVISERNCSALRNAYTRGIKLVPCTGRSMYELPRELHRLIDEFGFSVFSHIITDNGAQIYDLPQKKLLYTKNIPKKTAQAVLAEGRKKLALTYGSFGIQGATDNRGLVWEAQEAKPFIRRYEKMWGLQAADLEELIEWNDGLVKASMNFLKAGECEKCFKDFSRWPGLALSSSTAKNIELMRSGISKGEALDFVSRHTGIPMERIMAIGDNLNDMEMISRSGFGVAMGNAIPELKEKARWVTAANDDDGFALAIEKILAEV
jgi:Cof subfamily protein (haloacid dehalogenase superfamily)